MAQTCYLCGLPIDSTSESRDHAVPKVLIARKQPKVKGFDYGGVLPTHSECNNQFGPEAYCAKALDLLAALYDENCASAYQHKDDPSIQVMALKSECLESFTRRDLQFFKFIDVRGKDISEISDLSFFPGKPKTNPWRDSLFIALAVLTKSAAALLVSRSLRGLPSRWRVLAIPYSGATEAFDIDDLLGDTKPFNIGVKVWIRPFDSSNWFVLYRAQSILVFFLFAFSSSDTIWNGMIERFPDAGCLSFSGSRLIELIGYQWRRV
jgi:hypothetical protein